MTTFSLASGWNERIPSLQFLTQLMLQSPPTRPLSVRNSKHYGACPPPVIRGLCACGGHHRMNNGGMGYECSIDTHTYIYICIYKGGGMMH